MAKNNFRDYYTDLVEHYFRMAVRYEAISDRSKKHQIFLFTKRWLARLPEEEQQFVNTVFGNELFNTIEGIKNYHSALSLIEKRTLLAEIERKYAIDMKLI